MRYVFLLLILCLSFVALNSVTTYHSPFSFLSIGNSSPSSSIVYPIRRFHNAPTAAERSQGSQALKGGPSEGFGLTASAPAQAGISKPAAEESATDPNALGNVASAEMGMTGSSTINNPHNNNIANNLHRVAIAEEASPAVTDKTATTTVSDEAALAPQTPATEQIPVAGRAPATDAEGGINTASAAGSNPTANLAGQAMPASGQAVSAPDEDMDAPAQANLESALSMDADFLDMAPVPDAVAIQPSLSPFTLSQQAAAYAAFVADSIRNTLMDPHGIQFGAIAGLNWSGASATNTTGKVSGTPLSGFTLGAFADIPLKKNLSFRPEFLYSYEGYQPQIGGNKVNIHVAYLNVPLDLVYHTNLLNKRIFVGAGPYLAYAFNGTYTMKGAGADGANTDMQFGNNYAAGDNLKSTDFGAHFMAGILLDRNFLLGASVNLGLSNVSPTGAGSDIHTRSIGLSIGYVFRNKANTKTY